MTDEANDLVGQVVEERYRIETVLGAGAMGAVYRARHVRVGREVAIKVLHDHLIQDPDMVARFEREAAIAARLDHKNVISVIDVGETPAKQKLMVLELARGESLAAIIARGALAHGRVLNLVSQILDGLDHAHRAGLVHRDLKPENIMVERDEHGIEVPKIVDFGIAVLRDGDTRRLTGAGIVLGTPQYMAPEHAQGKQVDSRADLFALGVITYEMLAGRLPFDGSGVDAAISNMTCDPPTIAERAPGIAIDPLLEAFARRLMARRRGDRFHSAAAASDVLQLIATHREAARDILGMARRVRGTEAREALALGSAVIRPAHRPREFAMPTERVFVEPAAFAQTVEALAPCRPKQKPRQDPSLTRNSLPWYAIGLLIGVITGALVAGVLA